MLGVSLALFAGYLGSSRNAGLPSLQTAAAAAASPLAIQPLGLKGGVAAAGIRPALGRFPVLSAVPPDPFRVQASLAQIFNNDVLARAGIAVVADDGTMLFDRNAEAALAPASTMKLVVASTALNLLGPQYRFLTELVAEAPPHDGVIDGPLWLVGNGDPLLRSDELQAGVGSLARAGIHRITGDVLVDDSAFTGPERNPQWKADDLQYGYAAGTSAVSLDQGTAEFDVTPSLPGNPARVSVVPGNADVRLEGRIQTVLPGEGTLLRIELQPEKHRLHGPDNTFDVAGHIQSGEMQRYWQPVRNLARYAGFMLLSTLNQRAITVDGGVRVDPAPLVAHALWTHRSQPLQAILRDMLVTSNNHTAEQLLRVVGAQEKHVGTLQTGAAAERAELERLHIPTPGLHIVDGSGLSPANRIAAVTLAQLVAAELRTPEGTRFLLGLPRVGMEGTVRYHQVRDALGKARAKSGHIEGVNALAGTVQTTHHGRVAFAIIVNDPRAYDEAVTTAQDRMLDALARL